MKLRVSSSSRNLSDAQVMRCLESDREALVELKNGLNDPEKRLSSWKGSNCCEWPGISCDNSSGAVIAVDLHNPYPNGLYSSGRSCLSEASCDEQS
ncbi:hypothetical protein FEM48_Zijuj05G0022300 [Ziziphus jujuba var. spinosa]|uniref:Leucine-rich repeat-containing N-terminal plant-type domain-containing protein n=1 Tax=Ziziphus jujuba var. spinosa TaxID=714518 RepID=A0A978VC80_ZIZJJ|nr:hypothetical protein FEM48_Zijuj05G0022300 [Ziziphus jujuba var. spinosa]